MVRDRNTLKQYLLEQSTMDCYCVPCSNIFELNELSNVYSNLATFPLKKIIYSVSIILKLGFEYELDLFIRDYRGLDNALFLSNNHVDLDVLNKHREGLLIGLCLNGGELDYPLPSEGIIDFLYGIDYSLVKDFKRKYNNYMVVPWPNELKDMFDDIMIDEDLECCYL